MEYVNKRFLNTSQEPKASKTNTEFVFIINWKLKGKQVWSLNTTLNVQ